MDRPTIDPKKATPSNFSTQEECDRITSMFVMHHEHCGADPLSAQCTFSERLDNVLQPYVRRFNLDKEWKPLDVGWLGDKAGYVVIENKATLNGRVLPTDEQREAIKNQIIEVSQWNGDAVLAPAWIVRPGRVLVAELANLPGVMIRASDMSSGSVPVNITVMPS